MPTNDAHANEAATVARIAENLGLDSIAARQPSKHSMSKGIRAFARAASRVWNLLKWREAAATGPSTTRYPVFGDVYLAAVGRRRASQAFGRAPRLGLAPTTSIPASMENAHV